VGIFRTYGILSAFSIATLLELTASVNKRQLYSGKNRAAPDGGNIPGNAEK